MLLTMIIAKWVLNRLQRENYMQFLSIFVIILIWYTVWRFAISRFKRSSIPQWKQSSLENFSLKSSRLLKFISRTWAILGQFTNLSLGFTDFKCSKIKVQYLNYFNTRQNPHIFSFIIIHLLNPGVNERYLSLDIFSYIQLSPVVLEPQVFKCHSSDVTVVLLDSFNWNPTFGACPIFRLTCVSILCF